MQWLARIIFSGRVKRMKRAQYAASLLAQGKIDEAEEELMKARPRRFFQDFALFHFIYGKVLMERGDLSLAEQHLHTALGLGLERASVKFNLAVLKLRQRQLPEALALLDDVEAAPDAGLDEEITLMRGLIDDVRSGEMRDRIRTRASRFQKKHLPKASKTAKQLAELSNYLKSGKAKRTEQDDAALFLGQLMVEQRQATWSFGLEPRDHVVIVDGYPHSPAAQIAALLAGELDILTLPST